jgi:pectate lyase
MFGATEKESNVTSLLITTPILPGKLDVSRRWPGCSSRARTRGGAVFRRLGADESLASTKALAQGSAAMARQSRFMGRIGMKMKHYLALFGAGTFLGCAVHPAEDADVSALGVSSLGSAPGGASAHRDLGREALQPNDGWASLGSSTTGGSLAAPEQVYVVTNRAEFIAALNNGVASPTSPSNPSILPKIVYVDGTIDFNVDDADQPLTCADHYRNGYTPEAFREAYDPALWGRVAPSGPLETARLASQAAQQARVRMRVGSNTTIVGLGKHARLRGVWLDIRGSSTLNASNIIIRNLTFQDTADCFPAWAPTDGALGAWNSLYDAVSLRNADHVWIDHNTFEDRETADTNQPSYFGVLFQVHDGALDITNASDLVTVSFNHFRNHDKVMLIGSSDGATADRGKLRVTLHHNLFDEVGQRAPRVRFGQVHVYNNYYKIERNPAYVYSWGVGIESAIYAENNFFKTDESILPEQFIARFNGSAILESGTQLDGTSERNLIDVVSAYNAVNDVQLSEEVGWTPELFLELQATSAVPSSVQNAAGPLDW